MSRGPSVTRPPPTRSSDRPPGCGQCCQRRQSGHRPERQLQQQDQEDMLLTTCLKTRSSEARSIGARFLPRIAITAGVWPLPERPHRTIRLGTQQDPATGDARKRAVNVSFFNGLFGGRLRGASTSTKLTAFVLLPTRRTRTAPGDSRASRAATSKSWVSTHMASPRSCPRSSGVILRPEERRTPCPLAKVRC